MSSILVNSVAVVLSFIFWTTPVMAQQELLDPKTREYTPRGLAAILIASAQVSEMRCGLKGQITAALAKVKRLGVPFDLNDKFDYSDVVFMASQVLSGVEKEGVAIWCRDKAPNIIKLLQEP